MPEVVSNRRNFTVLLIDTVGFSLGMSFLSAQVILPGFLGRLGAGNVSIGLVPALANLGVFLPPLFIAAWVERRPFLRLHVFWVAIVERIPFALLALAAWSLGTRSPAVLLVLFFVLWSVNNLAMGFNLPIYLALVAKTSHPNERGKLFGLGNALGGLLGAAGAVLSRCLLLRLGFPDGYAVSFAMGFAVLMLSSLPFPFISEPHGTPAPGAPGLRGHLRGLPRVLREDPGFTRFVLAQGVLILANMAAGFFAVYATRRLGAGPGLLGLYNIVLMAAGSLSSPCFGLLADRYGHRAVLELAGVAAGLAALAAAASSLSPGLMMPAFFLAAAVNAALYVSSFMIVLEFSGPARTATYSALAMGLTVPLRFGVPLLAGYAADLLGYMPVFLASALAGLVAAALLRFGVPEPRRRTDPASIFLPSGPSGGEESLV